MSVYELNLFINLNGNAVLISHRVGNTDDEPTWYLVFINKETGEEIPIALDNGTILVQNEGVQWTHDHYSFGDYSQWYRICITGRKYKQEILNGTSRANSDLVEKMRNWKKGHKNTTRSLMSPKLPIVP